MVTVLVLCLLMNLVVVETALVVAVWMLIL